MSFDREAFVQGSVIPHHPNVVDLCPVNESEKLQQIFAWLFDSQAVDKPRYSAVRRKIWGGLPRNGLDCLCFQDCQRRFTIWIGIELDIDTAARTWLRKLGSAVRSG